MLPILHTFSISYIPHIHIFVLSNPRHCPRLHPNIKTPLSPIDIAYLSFQCSNSPLDNRFTPKTKVLSPLRARSSEVSSINPLSSVFPIRGIITESAPFI